MNDGPSLGGQSVSPVQVVLPVELRGVVRPPLDLDDDPFAEEAEVDTGDEVATGVGDDVLLQDLEAGANEQPAPQVLAGGTLVIGTLALNTLGSRTPIDGG